MSVDVIEPTAKGEYAKNHQAAVEANLKTLGDLSDLELVRRELRSLISKGSWKIDHLKLLMELNGWEPGFLTERIEAVEKIVKGLRRDRTG